MKFVSLSRIRTVLMGLCPLVLLAQTALAGSVVITSPRPGSTVTGGEVAIAASASESTPFHLEAWDNGRKLGDVFSSSVNTRVAFPAGPHVLTVETVSSNGKVLDQSSVRYSVVGQPAPPASNVVRIASPAAGATSISAVRIAASASESTPFHLAVWDNGYKLGDIPAGTVDDVYVLPNGSHVLTVQAIDSRTGAVLDKSSVNYKVAEDCSDSTFSQCDLDRIGADNSQHDCNPRQEVLWVANPCGGGVQGTGGSFPQATLVESVVEGTNLPNAGNLTLNGRSLHLSETQGNSWSNVLFRGQTPVPAPSAAIDSHWTMDEYVYLPNPGAHQAFEMDAQYSAAGIWTKFYTECAFNIDRGTGYWGVFDSATGGWIFLNGKPQNGQTPPVVPCNRSQFSQPWPGSGNPGFTGWHHIAWSFLRNPDGTVTYQSLTFDGTTTQVNFRPNSGTGGRVSDNGNFSALIQLDGVNNGDRQHSIVDAYVSEVNLIHTP